MGNNKKSDKLMAPKCRKRKNNALVTKSHLPMVIARPTIPEFLIPNSQTAVDRVTDFWNVEAGREFGGFPEQFLPDFPCE